MASREEHVLPLLLLASPLRNNTSPSYLSTDRLLLPPSASLLSTRRASSAHYSLELGFGGACLGEKTHMKLAFSRRYWKRRDILRKANTSLASICSIRSSLFPVVSYLSSLSSSFWVSACQSRDTRTCSLPLVFLSLSSSSRKSSHCRAWRQKLLRTRGDLDFLGRVFLWCALVRCPAEGWRQRGRWRVRQMQLLAGCFSPLDSTSWCFCLPCSCLMAPLSISLFFNRALILPLWARLSSSSFWSSGSLKGALGLARNAPLLFFFSSVDCTFPSMSSSLRLSASMLISYCWAILAWMADPSLTCSSEIYLLVQVTSSVRSRQSYLAFLLRWEGWEWGSVVGLAHCWRACAWSMSWARKAISSRRNLRLVLSASWFITLSLCASSLRLPFDDCIYNKSKGHSLEVEGRHLETQWKGIMGWNGWLQLLIMLKQALGKSPLQLEDSSIHDSEEEQPQQQPYNTKTSLLTQVLASTQRTSNPNDTPLTHSLDHSVPDAPLFLDRSEEEVQRKKETGRHAVFLQSRLLQVRAGMEMGRVGKRVEVRARARANVPNCSSKCQIY